MTGAEWNVHCGYAPKNKWRVSTMVAMEDGNNMTFEDFYKMRMGKRAREEEVEPPRPKKKVVTGSAKRVVPEAVVDLDDDEDEDDDNEDEDNEDGDGEDE